MRSSSKSRSRNKNRNNNRSNLGNVVNRVFDSSGPEGKVRGTPQQIIDKYQTLARDAQLSGDRVNAENFLQHAEHYVRMLGTAQKEMDQRREQQESQRQQQNNNQSNNNQNNNQNNHNNNQNQNQHNQQDKKQQAPVIDASSEQPSIPQSDNLFVGQEPSNLVETPESKPAVAEKKPAPRRRTPKPKADVKPKVDAKPKAEAAVEAPVTDTKAAE